MKRITSRSSALKRQAHKISDGLAPELRKVLETIGIRNANSLSEDELLLKLKNNKTEYAVEFAAQVRSNSDLAQRTPVVFQNAVKKLRGLEKWMIP